MAEITIINGLPFVSVLLHANDQQLVDALLQAGIPREKIILVYAGEPVPAAA